MNENKTRGRKAEEPAEFTAREAPVADDEALAAREAPGALAAIPDDVFEDAGKGTDAIGPDDVRPPRLALCQSLTKQRIRSDPKWIDGLQEGSYFNDLTEEIYGEAVDIVIVRPLGARGILFEEGNIGKVRELNVPLDDPRMQFRDDPENPGQRLKPEATKFYDYVAMIAGTQEVVALSFHGTGLKTAIKLNSFLKLPIKLGGRIAPNPPAWARVVHLESFPDTKDSYNFYGTRVRLGGLASDEDRAYAREMNAFFAGKTVVIEHAEAREPGSDDGPAAPGAAGGKEPF